MRSLLAVHPKEAGLADLSIPAFRVGPETLRLMLNLTPQTIDKDVIKAALPSCRADLDQFLLKPVHKVGRGELTALI